jgi:hypothetical protein
MKKLPLLILAFALVAPLAASGSPPAPNLGTLSREAFLSVLGNLTVGVPDPVQVQVDPCPMSVSCTSTTGLCAINENCTVRDLGSCCAFDGEFLCCVNGQHIKVQRCPCSGIGCPSAEITLSCS